MSTPDRDPKPESNEKREDKPERPHRITYTVNGEEQTTDQHELSVTAILESAGFTPATDYVLSSEKPPVTYADYALMVKLHQKMRFHARFIGPTPTSDVRPC